MRIFIPTIGTILELTQDWIVEVHHEYRNSDFLNRLGLIGHEHYHYRRADGPASYSVVLPAGTRLKVDRLYLKKGSPDFDSVTFWVNSHQKARRVDGVIKGRFWAKLKDVNGIEADVIETPAHAGVEV